MTRPFDVSDLPLDDLRGLAEPPGTWRKLPVEIRAAKMLVPFRVTTLEGEMVGQAGDYLIVGVEGERYPCARRIFEATYEPLSEARAAI